jgi:hypothetical protein
MENLNEFLATVERDHSTNEELSEVELFRKLARLDALKKFAGELEKMITKVRAPLEEQALSRFEQMGINNFNIDGRTVYLHREWWAKSKDGNVERTIAALKACEETAPFVKETFNTQSLSAYFRERRLALEGDVADHDGALYPTQAIEDAVDFSEKISVRSRQGGGK